MLIMRCLQIVQFMCKYCAHLRICFPVVRRSSVICTPCARSGCGGENRTCSEAYRNFFSHTSAKVIICGIRASSGVIHVIDSVLIPPVG